MHSVVPRSVRVTSPAPSDATSCSTSSIEKKISTPDKIVLPDLVSHCPFTLNTNPHWKKVGAQSEAWLRKNGALSVKKQRALHGLRCGLLSGLTYPDCGPQELRVCCDYLEYLFHLDDISDRMDRSGTGGTRAAVMNSLTDPEYKTNARVGKMTKE